MPVSQKKGGVLLSYIQMATNVLVKFIYTPFLLRALGQSEYGLFSLVMSIIGYLAILDLGFGGTVTRYTVKYRAENDRDSLYKLYGTLSVVYIAIGFLALLICFVLNLGAESLFGATMTGEEIRKLKIMILLVGVNLLFSFPLQISTSVVVAYEKFIFKNGVALFKTLLQPTIMILLLYLVNMKAVGAIVTVTIFNFITYLSYYVYSVLKLDFKFSVKCFDSSIIKSVLSFSFWMFLLMIFEQLQYNSGQFIIGLFNGTEVIAIWGIAMIFILNFRSLSSAISNVFAPSLMQKYFQSDEGAANGVIMRMTRLQSVILFYILFNFILFGAPFIEIWAGPQYSAAYHCSVIVMVPMALALILDFCYWSQVAKNHFLFRTVTTYCCLIVSFVVVYLIRGIDLISYAFFMALSLVTGQIICILIYIRRNLKISILEILKNILNTSFPMLVVCTVFYVIFNVAHFHLLTDSSFVRLIIDVFIVNIVLIPTTWFLSLNREERKMVFCNRKAQ